MFKNTTPKKGLPTQSTLGLNSTFNIGKMRTELKGFTDWINKTREEPQKKYAWISTIYSAPKKKGGDTYLTATLIIGNLPFISEHSSLVGETSCMVSIDDIERDLKQLKIEEKKTCDEPSFYRLQKSIKVNSEGKISIKSKKPKASKKNERAALEKLINENSIIDKDTHKKLLEDYTSCIKLMNITLN